MFRLVAVFVSELDDIGRIRTALLDNPSGNWPIGVAAVARDPLIHASAFVFPCAATLAVACRFGAIR